MLKNIITTLSLCFLLFNPLNASESIPERICSSKKCYRIIDVLGEGAFGKVYSAEDESGTLYAIKCYKKNNYNSFNFYSDPKREFEIGQILDHPNIIKTYDYFSDISDGNQVDYLVLQYVEGGALFQYPKKCMGKEESVKAFKKLLAALSYALTQNRVHLDLHSGNLMLDQNYELMVIDLASFFSFEEINDFFMVKNLKSNTEVQKRHLFNEAKLEKFFDENPRLFAQIQQVYQGNVARDSGMSREIQDSMLLIFMVNYFNRITDSCVEIVLRADIDRTERVPLRGKLKNIAWNYEEDADEGIDQSISYYIEELSKLSSTLF